MNAIETRQIEMMRDAISDTLPDTCAILSGTVAVDDYGGHSLTWGTTTTSVSCRMDARAGREQLTGAAVQPYQQYTLTLPYDATLTTDNRVVHGGETYNVISVDVDKSWAICKRAVVERA